MYNLVCNDRYYRNLSYRKLLSTLRNIEFTYTIGRDVNRAIDGIDFRYRFGYECGYPREIIEEELDILPCSVLEMIIALAFRIVETIMDDPEYGDRTGQWFWNMIVSLGLGNMNDSRFDSGHVEDIIYRFLNHEYERNGEGGLFTVQDDLHDMRYSEIWYQAMWYLNEF
jgi:hypothetical protein